MIEGQLCNGLLKGYGRKLNNMGECKVGYWDVLSNGSDIDVPSGKWAWYTKDGQFKVREGFYTGKQDKKS